MSQTKAYTFYTSSLESYDLRESRASDFHVRICQDILAKRVVELRLGYTLPPRDRAS